MYHLFLFSLSTNGPTQDSQVPSHRHCFHDTQHTLPSLLPFDQRCHARSSGPTDPNFDFAWYVLKCDLSFLLALFSRLSFLFTSRSILALSCFGIRLFVLGCCCIASAYNTRPRASTISSIKGFHFCKRRRSLITRCFRVWGKYIRVLVASFFFVSNNFSFDPNSDFWMSLLTTFISGWANVMNAVRPTYSCSA